MLLWQLNLQEPSTAAHGDFFPAGHFPEGHFPEGHFPETNVVQKSLRAVVEALSLSSADAGVEFEAKASPSLVSILKIESVQSVDDSVVLSFENTAPTIISIDPSPPLTEGQEEVALLGRFFGT